MNKIILLILFFLFISPDAFAALSVVQHTGNTGGGNTLAVTVAATGNGNLLVAATVTYNPTQTVSSISDGANNFTQVPNAHAVDAIKGTDDDVWYLPKSTAGKTTITLNLSGAAAIVEMEVWEVSGFTLPKPDVVGVVNTGLQSGGFATGAAVGTTSTKGFVVGVDVTDLGVTVNPKPGNEFTSGGDINANGDGFCSLISSTAASHQPEWTDFGNDFASSTVAFKESTPVLLLGNAKLNKAKIGL